MVAYAQAYVASKEVVMQADRHIRLFRNGANQALRIPRDLELPGNEAVIRKEGDRLIVEAVRKPSLLALLAALQPLDEDFPEIEDPPVDDADVEF
jgi:antitoxin VapB